VPSLFVGVALTATSVGVAVALWDEADLLKTDDGELMLDVAELDDVSGVVLMGVLFTLAPVFHANPAASLIPLAAQTLGGFALKFAAFTAGCIAVSLYVEEPLTVFFEQIQRWPGTIMVVLGIGMVVAAIASLLGFSLAIGAFFAGLIFSRDPKAVKMETSFNAFYPLFAAFFFIDIGLRIDPTALGGALGPVLVLLAAAVIGKGLGVLLPALALTSSSGALLLSLSLVPRAEIMLIIMQRGLDLGPWAVPPELFAQMVLVSAATTLLVPPLVRPLFSHLPSSPNSL
jgi:Kef-type K+ transport system membrane component KefB